jgi:hypothetical protein
LWYFLNANQQITAVSAQVYFFVGSDEEKGAALERASCSDHETVPKLEIEPVHYSKLAEQGVEDFFRPVFKLISRALPDDVQLPEEKLYFATPMYDFGQGFVPARIGDGFITERR